MALGTLTIKDDIVMGNARATRVTLVGDGSYPTGGSLGLELALRAATKQHRKIVAVAPCGDNGDVQFDFVNAGPDIDCTVDATTNLFTASAAHNLSSGDAVEVEYQYEGFGQDALQSPLAAETTFYVIAAGLTATAFKLSATSGGASLDIEKSGAVVVRKGSKLMLRVGSTGAEVANATDKSGSTYGLLLLST